MKLQKKFIATDILGLLALLISCLVMYGWYAHSLILIQLSSSFAPMQFNTALCFLLCGFSLILLNHNQTKLIPLIIFPVILIALLTLWAYIFSQKSMIDELFIKAFLSTNPQYPGRMAPNAALAFCMFGLSTLIISRCSTHSMCFVKVNLAINFFIISLCSLAL